MLLVLLVTLSLTAACTETVTVTVPSSTTAATNTTSTTPPSSVTIVKVTGSPATANSVTIVDNGQESQHKEVTLPFIVTLPNNPSALRVTAQAGGESTASITCEIDQPGKAVSDASSGAYAVVTCTKMS